MSDDGNTDPGMPRDDPVVGELKYGKFGSVSISGDGHDWTALRGFGEVTIDFQMNTVAFEQSMEELRKSLHAVVHPWITEFTAYIDNGTLTWIRHTPRHNRTKIGKWVRERKDAWERERF